ncbi:MAG: glycoside hydrolase family 172 protein [Planctomycetota bacterium]
MPRSALIFTTVIATAAALLSGCASTQPVTTATLLDQMTDLRGLAEFPSPAYTCRQFSSYDRKSDNPHDGWSWFANGDYNQFLRVEERAGRKEWVMMDAAGPGAIVRIWSANPKGTIRIYLDGAAEPVLALPMADLLNGKSPGIPEPIAHQRGRGCNSYLPIPYARHCKVTSDSDGFYYHVNYRTYPRGTRVVTFTAADLERLAPQIARVAELLAHPRRAADTRPPAGGAAPQTVTQSLEPNDILPLDFQGPGAIIGLHVKVDAPEADKRAALLRKLLLTMEFDNAQTVAVPLSDFFGAGPGAKAYESLPLGVTEEGGLWSHWVMPYQRHAVISVKNRNDKPVLVALGAQAEARAWTSRSMHFHAGWRVERKLWTRPLHDWNYVNVNGRGVFVGAAFTQVQPYRDWWGEGDEKIFVDAEKFPSHFGTGTEDYYGYAWGCPEPFVHAYHNQPQCDGPGSYGRTAINRWHILDCIPFQRSIRFDMEYWSWVPNGHVPEIAVTTYWYARPGATHNRPAPAADQLAYDEIAPYAAPRVEGVLEGEELRIVEQAGTPEPQPIDGTSNGQHLWWRKAKPGDQLVLAFDAPAAGRYGVSARFIQAADYGIARFTLNGRPLGKPMDFYAEKITITPERLLDVVELQQSENRLAIEIVGTNAKAEPKNHMVGLDYIRLQPLE